jgi:hypothetical protein
MPNLHQFPQVKCSENDNYRNNSLGGCRYEPKVSEFKPHNKGPKGTIKPVAPKPTTKPTAQPTILQPLAPNPTIEQPSAPLPSSTSQLSETLIQHGLGHLAPTPSRDDDTNDEPLWVRIIKAKAKSANKAGVDAYVKYSELTPSEVDAAKMTKSSYINLTEGQHAAHAYANKHIKGWTLDTSLTDEHTAVYVSKEGKVAIAYRGTQAGRDWKTNAKLALGQEATSQQIKEIESNFEKVINKYGKEAIEFFTGHSKGGGQAIHMGNTHGISTITQDPALTPKMIANSNPNIHHVINRTPTDWVSGLTRSATLLRDNFSNRLIQPTKGTGILGSHDVNLMTHFDYKPKGGQGNTDYDNKTQTAKDKAFLAKHIQSGMSFDKIASNVGYEKGSSDYDKLFEHYDEVSRNPSHAKYFKEAGYDTTTPTISSDLINAATNKAVSAVETATAKVGTAANTLVNRSTGANMVSSVAAAYALQGVGLDENTANIVGGGVGNIVGENVAQRIGIGTVIGGKNISIRNAGASGVISSAIGAGTQSLAYTALKEHAGLDHQSATVISSTASGAAQGASEYQANVAIAYAEKKYGRGVLSSAVRSAIAQGVERVGLTETLSAMTGRVGTGAMRGRWGGWYGTLIGAGIGAVSGIVEVATRPEEKEIYAILPSIFEGPDRAVGTDAEIIQIMKEFNESGDFSDERIQEIQAQLNTRMAAMRESGVLGMLLPPLEIQKVPEHIVNKDENIMLAGTYTERDLQEYREHLEEQTIAQNAHTSEEIARIEAMPAAAHGTHLINVIQSDYEYQQLRNAPIVDFNALNSRIRSIIDEKQSESHTFYDVINTGDTYPVLQIDGSWKMQKWNDPLPTAPLADDSVWRDEPHPQTAHEHAPLPKYEPPPNLPTYTYDSTSLSPLAPSPSDNSAPIGS